jgi:hypothetical protein
MRLEHIMNHPNLSSTNLKQHEEEKNYVNGCSK